MKTYELRRALRSIRAMHPARPSVRLTWWTLAGAHVILPEITADDGRRLSAPLCCPVTGEVFRLG